MARGQGGRCRGAEGRSHLSLEKASWRRNGLGSKVQGPSSRQKEGSCAQGAAGERSRVRRQEAESQDELGLSSSSGWLAFAG